MSTLPGKESYAAKISCNHLAREDSGIIGVGQG